MRNKFVGIMLTMMGLLVLSPNPSRGAEQPDSFETIISAATGAASSC